MLEFSFGGLINFLLGIFSGFVLFTVVYVYFIVRGKNVDLDTSNKPVEQVDEEQLKTLITDKQNAFKTNYKQEDKRLSKMVFDLSYDLVEEIAGYYYPDSPHPMLELSIDEMIDLNQYISKRIDSILDQPLLKNTRNLRVTRIVQLFEKKKQIEQSKAYRVVRNKKVNKIRKATLGAINVFNPAYWFRKLVVGQSVDFITKRVALMIIAVVGEETSKIYSKKLFDKDIEFDFVDKELEALEEGSQNNDTD